MERVTPAVLRDLYAEFSADDKREFLRRLAEISTPYVPLYIVSQLPKSQQFVFSGQAYGAMLDLLMPLLVKHARELSRLKPNLTDEEFDRELAAHAKEWVERTAREVGEVERERLKAKRDRKSDPETIRRNVEICDLRKADRRKWSLTRLAKKYGVSTRAITSVLSEEAKWRRKAARLGTE